MCSFQCRNEWSPLNRAGMNVVIKEWYYGVSIQENTERVDQRTKSL